VVGLKLKYNLKIEKKELKYIGNMVNLNLLHRLGVLILRKQNVISTEDRTEPKNSIFIYQIQKIIALYYNCCDICGAKDEIIIYYFMR